jgi:predicted dehydrogenase
MFNIGIIGTGNISSAYLRNLAAYEYLKVTAVADLDLSRAESQAATYGVPKACSVDELLADNEIDLVINLTIPAAHGSVGLAALQAGKHIYNEKPLAISRSDAQALLALASERGLRVGGAPDTFLGGGLQTCRALIDEGVIGEPIGATAFMFSSGPESWHPNPAFFYAEGAGPLFDMGPYYLTTLVSLLGPINRVSGSARISFPTRPITSQPLAGQTITVTTPTHVSATLEHASGPLSTLVVSFDVQKSQHAWIEIYGSTGTLRVPDPNTFGGPIFVSKRVEKDKVWEEIPITREPVKENRGIGVADMVRAIAEDRPHRASGEMTYHVLDLMHCIYESSNEGRHIVPTSRCERPAPLD